MTTMPSGAAIVRPFLPARDFDLSRRFYQALGFETLLDSSDVAIFGVGGSSFLLQRFYNEEWATNAMMQLMVEQLDDWWTYVSSLDLPARFGVAAPKAPAMQPWGLRVSYLSDPSGVLWHIAQRRPGVAHD